MLVNYLESCMRPCMYGLQIPLQLWKAWIIRALQHRCSKHLQARGWILTRCMQPQQRLRSSSSSRAASWAAWTPSLPPLPSSLLYWATPLQLLQHRVPPFQVWP